MNAKLGKKARKLKAKECLLLFIKIIKRQIKPYLESQISLWGHKMPYLLGNNLNLTHPSAAFLDLHLWNTNYFCGLFPTIL